MFAIIVDAALMMGILLSSFYAFTKSIRYTVNQSYQISCIAWCLFGAILFATGSFFVPFVLLRPLVCLLSIVFSFLLTKQTHTFETSVSAFLFSFGISHFLYYLSVFSVSTVFGIFGLLAGSEVVVDAPIDFNQPIYILIYSIVAILQVILSFLLFKIRRFRKGFPFIFNKYTIVAALIFTGTILVFVTWANMISASYENVYTIYLFVAGVLIAGGGIYILIRRLIKMFQRKKAQQNTADYYEKKWLEQKEKYKDALAIIESQRVIIHNFKDRIDSMEKNVSKQDKAELLEEVGKLRKDLQEKMSVREGKQLLPSTNITAIDGLFEHFARKCAEDNIDFRIIVNGSIRYMLDNIIKQGDLETLIVNHLKDAQIAVNASNNPFRAIMVMLGLANDCYELTVFDSYVLA